MKTHCTPWKLLTVLVTVAGLALLMHGCSATEPPDDAIAGPLPYRAETSTRAPRSSVWVRAGPRDDGARHGERRSSGLTKNGSSIIKRPQA